MKNRIGVALSLVLLSGAVGVSKAEATEIRNPIEACHAELAQFVGLDSGNRGVFQPLYSEAGEEEAFLPIVNERGEIKAIQFQSEGQSYRVSMATATWQIDPDDRNYQAITLELKDPRTGALKQVRIRALPGRNKSVFYPDSLRQITVVDERDPRAILSPLGAVAPWDTAYREEIDTFLRQIPSRVARESLPTEPARGRSKDLLADQRKLQAIAAQLGTSTALGDIEERVDRLTRRPELDSRRRALENERTLHQGRRTSLQAQINQRGWALDAAKQQYESAQENLKFVESTVPANKVEAAQLAADLVEAKRTLAESKAELDRAKAAQASNAGLETRAAAAAKLAGEAESSLKKFDQEHASYFSVLATIERVRDIKRGIQKRGDDLESVRANLRSESLGGAFPSCLNDRFVRASYESVEPAIIAALAARKIEARSTITARESDDPTKLGRATGHGSSKLR